MREERREGDTQINSKGRRRKEKGEREGQLDNPINLRRRDRESGNPQVRVTTPKGDKKLLK